MLDKRLSESHEVFSAPTRPDDCPRFNRRLSNRMASDRRAACEAMLVTLPDGERLRLSISPPRPPPSFGLRPDFIGYGILFLISIGILAALIARMTMRPLKRLAQAATALGVDIERPPLPEGKPLPHSMRCNRASATTSGNEPTYWQRSRMICRPH
jgi:hypothetical protein